MKTILSHANLIDCVEPKVRPDTAVLIENGRIRAILPSGEAGNVGDAQVIDLKGAYLRRVGHFACTRASFYRSPTGGGAGRRPRRRSFGRLRCCGCNTSAILT